VNDYVRSLLRFWWVLVVGLAIAQVAAIMAVYRVDLSSVPPELTQRQKPSYSAQGRLLVTSSDRPDLRNAITSQQAVPPTADGPRASIPVTSIPDTSVVVQAANVYPVFIEGDPVAKLRHEMFGPTPGTVHAQALYAVSSPSRFTPSRIPVIQVIGVADSPQKAIQLVDRTNSAFLRWLTQTQAQSGIKAAQRITVVPVQSPKTANEFGGSSSTLPVLVFGVVLMAFVALALFFDRMFPRPQVATAAEPVQEPAQIRA
jgi:hypothetical protein